MKKFLVLIAMVSIIVLSGCADSKKFVIDGKEVKAQPYGWANYESRRVDGVKYEINAGNVILSIIFSESIVVPVYLTGWEIMEPVQYKCPADKLSSVDAEKK
jgi:hypothetical protein